MSGSSGLIQEGSVHRVTRITVAVLAVALLAACGGEGGGAGADDGAPSRMYLSVGTAPPGGAFFVVGSALAEVINENGASEGYSVTAEATSGSQENIRRLATGELDFSLSNAAITYFAVRGAEGWDRAYPVRSVMTLAPNVAMFVTQTGSGIERLADLSGRRVTVGPAGAGFEYFVAPLLEAHGVTYEDFSPLNATHKPAVDMLTDGSADAVFLGGAVPTASITQAAASMDIQFLPFGDAEKQQLTSDFVFFRPATIPAETYRNQSEAFDGLDVGSMHLITSGRRSRRPRLQRHELLYENRESVVEKHAAGRAINTKNVVRDTGTEFHPVRSGSIERSGFWTE